MPTFTVQELTHTLEQIEPLELDAVSLLADLRSETGEWFPSSLSADAKSRVIAATVELVSYTKRCAALGRHLTHLQPIAIPTPLLEFAL